MDVKVVDSGEVLDCLAQEIGLTKPGIVRFTHDFYAQLARAAAERVLPSSAKQIVGAITEAIQPISHLDEAELRDEIMAAVEALLELGELVEISGRGQEQLDAGRGQIYQSPPAYVRRDDGNLLLVGGAPRDELSLPIDMIDKIRRVGYARVLINSHTNYDADCLRARGWTEMKLSRWLRAPSDSSPQDCLERYRSAIEPLCPPREIPGLQVINMARPSQFYKGRWTGPSGAKGVCVARWPKSYGPDNWGLVFLADEIPAGLVALPLDHANGWRGCDEAWYVQLALDAVCSNPQKVSIELLGKQQERVIARFFNPLPMWAHRKLSILGQRAEVGQSLFAYQFQSQDWPDEERFLTSHLWMITEHARHSEGAT